MKTDQQLIKEMKALSQGEAAAWCESLGQEEKDRVASIAFLFYMAEMMDREDAEKEQDEDVK